MSAFARYLLPILAAATLAGCGLKETYKVTGAEAAKFHAEMDAGQYEKIWAEAAPDFRKSGDKQSFLALMEAIGKKLGKVKETKQTGWNVNTNNGVTSATMTYDTTFERGKGTETFVYVWVKDDKLRLLGYNIKSTDMMLN